MDNVALTKILANIALFLMTLVAGAILGYELLTGKPFDPTVLTFMAFVIGNYAKSVGFDQAAAATNKTIETMNGTVAAIQANTGALQANTAQGRPGEQKPRENGEPPPPLPS